MKLPVFADIEMNMTTVSIPERILHYEILESLGSGPNGVVYRGRDKEQNEVAIKVIPNSICRSDHFRTVIEPAFQELKRIDHPNLCKIYSLVYADAGFVIVREYIESVSLKDTLFAHGRIAEFRLYDLLIQAAAGLSALHRHEFEHGNLHERNFFLSADGLVKLTDAGFNITAPTFTESPFVDSGLLIDHSADLRSLGQIVFKTITDQEWKSPQAPDPLDLQEYGLHSGGALIISQLLFKDAKENFATAADLSVSVKAVAAFAENHVEPVEVPKRDASPRQYLMMSVLVGLLIVLWYILGTHS